MNQKDKDNLRTQVALDRIGRSNRIIPLTFHNEKKFSYVTFNKDQTLLALCNDCEQLTILDALTFEGLNIFNTKSAIRQAIFHPVTDIIFCALATDYIQIFDPYTIQEKQKEYLFEYEDSRPLWISLSFSGDKLAVTWRDIFKNTDPNHKDTRVAIYDSKDCKGSEQPKIQKSLVPENFEERFTSAIFGMHEDILYICNENKKILKYNLKGEKLASTGQLFSNNLSSLTFSPHFEFLIASGNEGVHLLNPSDLTVFRSVVTRHPVRCAQLSSLAYSNPPKYHLIYGGGVPARDQATRSDAGNELFIYDISTEEKVFELADAFGNINWLELFADGSGVVTAGEEGFCRIYRFDQCFYSNKEFQ